MKKMKLLIAVATATFSMGITAFAGQWAQDGTGWWYDNGDGTWPAASLQWIDGNYDGIAELYYFDADGYLLQNDTVPFVIDELYNTIYVANEDGACMEDGIILTRRVPAGTVVERGEWVDFDGDGVPFTIDSEYDEMDPSVG